jgi:hypothetical protein
LEETSGREMLNSRAISAGAPSIPHASQVADNALDEGGQVHVGTLPNGGYFVEDDGGALDRGAEGFGGLPTARIWAWVLTGR